MNPLVSGVAPGPLLGVNIDHIATLRNARGGSFPDPVHAAQVAVDGGADIITFHLREDRRHIRDADVQRIKADIRVPLNFESAVTDEMLGIIERIRPQMVCLVPERRQEITTEGGLDVAGQLERVRNACARLGAIGCRVSLFIEASPVQIEASARAGAPCVELHTGAYANACEAGDDALAQAELRRLHAGIEVARGLGLQTNAGHGLTLASTPQIAAMGQVSELHIGHALVGHALFVGMAQSVRDFKAVIARAAAPALTARP
ncbi:MAG: pyridoxine 5'-phosphate synthase [Thiomonas sp. 13-66-29]|jgi:pyridoxine 5-phosphate synthase|uniref:Pyridoxine 5'-phosphate synthase n=1 Tax=Thiomonas delicata TaxID=364030 RepID=A0A238D5S8_THIDL|nr:MULTISPECIES: pyridoxine 5'-phosphate synthase [Thiomonas]OZB45206.1 MAG: pyridoxine 5'-phosphate synthase [Thiomonas sp. 15-66-11]OZB65882.1 MAG: pyridoxine 5'-phosphate synthase [Thiomonas sp. 13-66-29]SBP88656.1 pyridoxine 5'-phosphate synthase [Thiomonas delicata]